MWPFPCAVPRQRGDSPQLPSPLLFLKVLSIIQKVMLEGRRDLGNWGHEKDHLCRFAMPVPRLERTKDADEHGAKLYIARSRLLTMTMEKKKRNSFLSPSLRGRDVQGCPACLKDGDRNFCYILMWSAVRPSSFLRKFSHFQFVLLAGLVSMVLLIIEVCLAVFCFCCHQSRKPKNHKRI